MSAHAVLRLTNVMMYQPLVSISQSLRHYDLKTLAISRRTWFIIDSCMAMLETGSTISDDTEKLGQGPGNSNTTSSQEVLNTAHDRGNHSSRNYIFAGAINLMSTFIAIDLHWRQPGCPLHLL